MPVSSLNIIPDVFDDAGVKFNAPSTLRLLLSSLIMLSFAFSVVPVVPFAGVPVPPDVFVLSVSVGGVVFVTEPATFGLQTTVYAECPLFVIPGALALELLPQL